MRIRNTFVLNLAIVGAVAALLTIPGEAKQPATTASAPQSAFGLFLDTDAAPVLTIALPNGFRSV